MPTIVVFCHLRWDFVFQRPQQLLTRLARHYHVLFVEEPVHDAGKSFMELSSPAPNVTVCRPHTPIQAGGFHDDQIPLLQPLLAQLVAPGEQLRPASQRRLRSEVCRHGEPPHDLRKRRPASQVPHMGRAVETSRRVEYLRPAE